MCVCVCVCVCVEMDIHASFLGVQEHLCKWVSGAQNPWNDEEPGSGGHLEATHQTGIVHDWADSFSRAVTQEHEAVLIIAVYWLLSMTETHWLYMQKADKFN